jgi:hypothetical protein
VLVLLLLIPHLKRATPAPAVDTTTENAASTDAATGGARGAATTLSRTDALATYQGKMITIADDCTVTPDTQTQAAGTTILINNNGTARHTVMIGSKSYTVSGLHYTLSWLNMGTGDLAISCDGKDTGAKITLQ